MNAAPATLDRAGIAARIPHAGAMCLLDALLSWNADEIVCRADHHNDPDHPLRLAAALPAACALEYASQAMALHAALCVAAHGPTPGFLASARGVRLHRLRLDDLDGDLRIEARRGAGDDRQVLYTFAVSHAGEPVAEGRATVVLNTPLAGP